MTGTVEEGIVTIISDISGVDGHDITLDTNFQEDLEIDSIKTIEITVAIEKKFKISVRDEDVPKIRIVRQAVDLVSKLLKQVKS